MLEETADHLPRWAHSAWTPGKLGKAWKAREDQGDFRWMRPADQKCVSSVSECWVTGKPILNCLSDRHQTPTSTSQFSCEVSACLPCSKENPRLSQGNLQSKQSYLSALRQEKMESPRVDHTHMERNLNDPYCSFGWESAPQFYWSRPSKKRVIIVFGLPGMEMFCHALGLGSKLTSEKDS